MQEYERRRVLADFLRRRRAQLTQLRKITTLPGAKEAGEQYENTATMGGLVYSE
jgi:hypothetical protein